LIIIDLYLIIYASFSVLLDSTPNFFFANLFLQNRDGATGDEIVEALIANSSTFGKKTVFSQVSIIFW